jgi:hypothetical protein
MGKDLVVFMPAFGDGGNVIPLALVATEEDIDAVPPDKACAYAD